ncbi:MAG: hypothetical protein V4663_14560 [Bacteroidota bacterium]
MTNHLNILPEKQFISDWLKDHDRNLSAKDSQTLELLCRNLNYDKLSVEIRLNGENIIIIPIDEVVIEHLNLVQPLLKLNENSVLNLMIVQSTSGKLRWSSIISFLAADGTKRLKLLEKTIENILNQAHVEETGMFKFINLNGSLAYQLEFKHGSMSSWGSIVSGDYLPKKRRKKLGLTDVDESCRYYLVTTYHNSDKGKRFSEEYLYTANDSDSIEFGNGEPEEENDMAIEISGSSVSYSDDDFFSGENDEYLNCMNIQITFHEVQPDEEELILAEITTLVAKYLENEPAINVRSFSKNRLSFYIPALNRSALGKFTAELMQADLDITSINSSGPSTYTNCNN